jgi:hypothetical protein
VPRSIRSLWVSSGMPTTTGGSLACQTTLVGSNAQRCEANIDVVDSGRSVLEVEGLVLQSLGRSIDQQQEDQEPWAKELCADVRWAPELALSAGLPGAAEAIKAKLPRHTGGPDSTGRLQALVPPCQVPRLDEGYTRLRCGTTPCA